MKFISTEEDLNKIFDDLSSSEDENEVYMEDEKVFKLLFFIRVNT